MAEFKSVELFGGAIAVDIPTAFADVSDIRQVPDNQEVFLAKEGFTSITFDILEQVPTSTATTDEDALKYHFHDIVSTDTEDAPHIWSCSAAHLAKMPDTPTHVLFATIEEHLKAKSEFVGVLLILIRLEKQQTDIVVFINVPHVKGEYDPSEVDIQARKLSPQMKDAEVMRQRVLETFEIKEWGLFVNEE